MKNGVTVSNNPPLLTLFDKARMNIFQTLNCVKIGKILSFDAVKRTAKVQITFVRKLNDGSLVPFPELQDCPVFSLQGGGGALTFPVAAGDECLLLFSDSNIDAWYSTGLQGLPYDSRRHDISDCIALVGLNSLAHPISPAVTASEVSLTYGGAKIAEKNGKIQLANGAQSFLTAMDTFLTGLDSTTIVAKAAALKVSIDALFY